MPPKDMRVDEFKEQKIRLTIKGQEIKNVEWDVVHGFYKDVETGNRVPKSAVQQAWANSQKDGGLLAALYNQQLGSRAITLAQWRDQILQLHADQFWSTLYILNGGLDPERGSYIKNEGSRSLMGAGKDEHFATTERYVNGLCHQITDGFFGDNLESNDFDQRVKALMIDKLEEFSDWRTEDDWENE
jgi:hypothetical protein